jgi:hypothetical protein
MSSEIIELTGKVNKSAQLLNYGCANRIILLDKEITIVPPSIRLFLNPHAGTDVANTEHLINHILGKKDTIDDVSSKFEKKNEYSTLARATDDLCGVSSKLVDSLIYSA